MRLRYTQFENCQRSFRFPVDDLICGRSLGADNRNIPPTGHTPHLQAIGQIFPKVCRQIFPKVCRQIFPKIGFFTALFKKIHIVTDGIEMTESDVFFSEWLSAQVACVGGR